MIRRIELTNFRRHADTAVEFSPDEQLIVISGNNGVGKCLPGDETVWDLTTGEQIPLATFVARRCRRTLGYRDGSIRPVRVTAWHTLAERPLVEIRIGHRRLRAAATHPVLTTTGWKVAGILGPGDLVGVFDGKISSRGLLDPSGRLVRSAQPRWEPVDEVVPAGRQQCFDLTVDSPEHAYVAGDGIITHNSTLVSEALLFAFYGESRHGRRRLDELVRRGAELEGVEVSVAFEISGRRYRVDRRRVEGISSARLSVDGIDLADSTTAVDEAITRILGMDSAGFRLAVLARQNELDGLTSLDRPTRRRVLGRLLRLDAVASAAAAANADYRRAADVLAAFGPVPDLNSVNAELTAAEDRLAKLQSERERVEAEVSQLSTLAVGLDHIDTEIRAAEAAEAAAAAAAEEAAGILSRLESQVAALTAQLSDIVVPPISTPSAELIARRAQLTALADRAEADRRAAADRAVLESDLAEHHAARERLVGLLAELAEVDTQLDSARAQTRERRAQYTEARAAVDEAASALAVARSERETARRRVTTFSTVGTGVCDRCGSTLDESHLATHRAELAEALTSAETQLEAALRAHTTARDLLEEAESALAEGLEAEQSAIAAAEQRDRAQAELERTESRIRVLSVRLASPPPAPADLDEIRGQLSRIEAELSATLAAEAVAAEAETLRTRLADLTVEADEARRRAQDLSQKAIAARVPDTLRVARDQRETIQRQLAAARERLADLREACASGRGEVDELTRRRGEMQQATLQRERRAHQARVAAHTKAVLTACHQVLSVGLRPALEAAATELLSRLSEGRFPAVRVTDDYDILVSDDGAFRTLGELSGGETDLVALGVRLALSQVVAERHGSDALGLLVLDEVFGSQDASRRSAILAGLRELRGIYGQIFLISHVGGLEDAADRVVELDLDPDRRTFCV